MLEYQGKIGKAKVMIDKIDSATVSQIYEFLNHEAFTNPIAIMPDTHAGAGAVIGFTMELTSKIIPNVIGVDIGCGMLSMDVGSNALQNISREDLDSQIRTAIPFGTNVRKNAVTINDSFWKNAYYGLNSLSYYYNRKTQIGLTPPITNQKWLEKKCEDIGIDYDRVVKSLGTLGGGNHFIEVGKSENTNHYWVTVHSGSRQFGLKIAQYWQKKAGKGQLAFLEGEDAYNYLMDMQFAQFYASQNRVLMAREIIKILNIDPTKWIESVHNYIDFNDWIIRKGAISAHKDQEMIIPFSMETGLLICKGKGNEEWNQSAPHGAGRLGSRRWAKETLSLDEARSRMKYKGIFCSKLPIDECGLAYKDPKIIEDAITPTAEVIDRIKPVLAMKD